jgi:hypothetical protein
MSGLLTAFPLALFAGWEPRAPYWRPSPRPGDCRRSGSWRGYWDETTRVTPAPEQYGAVFKAYLLLKRLEGFGLVQARPGEELAQLRRFQIAGAVILGLLALVLRLPVALVPVGVGIGYLLPKQLANGAWGKTRTLVDEQLLTLVAEMAAAVNFTTDPVEIVRRAEVSLRGAGHEILADELPRTLAEVHQRGTEAWQAAEQRAEALSATLSTLYFILRRLKQTGGAGFSAPFQTAATNLTEIIATRQIVRSKAESGKSTMYMITAVFVLIVGSMLFNPICARRIPVRWGSWWWASA